MKAMKVRMDIL